MVVLKQNPIGIDAVIQAIQVAMYEYLAAKWHVDYMCYGRAYKNQIAGTDGYVPEVFVGGIDYRDVYNDDRIPALSFFTYDRNTFDSLNTATIGLIFTVDLPSLKPGIAHRADEEVRNDVLQFLLTEGYTDSPVTTVTGINNVFAEFTGYRSADSIKHTDMHPRHCFRFNFSLYYNSIAKNC